MSKTPVTGVIGAGAMGSGIAQVMATAGENVKILDASSAALERSRLNLVKSLEHLIGKGKLTGQEAEKIQSRISYVSRMSDFSESNLILEAVVEDLAVKQKLFQELESVVSADTILASNTSSISISSIASACKIPKRIIGIHFFNPATIMPLVEIIPSVTTDANLASEIKQRVLTWKKVPVISKDSPGFIVNRVARPYYGEAIRIYEEGIADFATIDWALKEFGGFKMGPFELMDLIGNDVNFTVTQTVWKQFFYDPKFKPSLTQQRLFEAGRFGRKTGMGYYDYSSSLPEPTKDVNLGQKICFRVLVMLINEACDALFYQVASKEDIDLAMTKGVNYPKGLLQWADEIGHEKIIHEIEILYSQFKEDRYRLSPEWSKMKAIGKNKFYQ